MSLDMEEDGLPSNKELKLQQEEHKIMVTVENQEPSSRVPVLYMDLFLATLISEAIIEESSNVQREK